MCDVMTQEVLERRLLQYAKRCVLLSRELFKQPHDDGKTIARQLIRSGTHPGIHYGEARAAESRKDYIHKLGVLLKELREAHNTIQLIELVGYFPDTKLKPILQEGHELISIFTATVIKLKKNEKT